jgi:hypothetical protein
MAALYDCPLDEGANREQDQCVRRTAVAAVLIAGMLQFGASAADAASVRQVSLTSPVLAGAFASLTVNVAPRARCTIRVIYNTATESRILTDAGLNPKTGGTLTWRWRIPKDAHPTRTPIELMCGDSGELRSELLVGPIPELPRILSARLVSGTKFGKAVRLSYCFRSLPTDPRIRPWRLSVTVDNLRDGLPPLNVGWEVTKRCGTIIHPVGGIKPPYQLRYSVEPVSGTYSRQGKIRL